MYLHEHTGWTHFTWDDATVLPLLGEARFAQGELLGSMSGVGFDVKSEVEVQALSGEVVASSRIEGVVLDAEEVRSSVSRQLGLEGFTSATDTRDVDGAVSVMLDATRRFAEPLSDARLFGWHNALFPAGYSGLRKIHVARYREGPMRVVSGPIGKERVHFLAPDPDLVPLLMGEFVSWVNECDSVEPLLKAGIAHLWYLTVHPFDDGNGRIARALTELLLARSDGSPRRFYSMAQYILAHREGYYCALEHAQKGSSDITEWLAWFLRALQGSIEQSKRSMGGVLGRVAFWNRLEGVPLNDRQRTMLERLKGGFEGKLTASKWAKICKVSADTALRDINDLMDKGVLVRSKAGGRSVSYALKDDPGERPIS
ncbi:MULTISPECIES: Fic family protein [unclassified Adlercreutzia]|uniref:Fic family protein n=1 Tax=unclassified Adlercreutzia TaxID=2636013 RepID=UPI0013EB3FBA|nr:MULTISPECIES: Fic family protein [unclassified Adlercreutzia]